MTITPPAGKTLALNDIQLRVDLSGKNTKFAMGFGRSGGAIDAGFGGLPLHWRWGDGPYQLWAGSPDVGMRLKLTGPEAGWAAPSYSGTSSWRNGGRGGANITRAGPSKDVELVCFTGPITINASQTLTLYFELLLTPVKPLDQGLHHPHWGQRHYQVGYGNSSGSFATPAEVAATGATVANLHQVSVSRVLLQGRRTESRACLGSQGIGATAGLDWPGHTAVDQGLLNPVTASILTGSNGQFLDW